MRGLRAAARAPPRRAAPAGPDLGAWSVWELSKSNLKLEISGSAINSNAIVLRGCSRFIHGLHAGSLATLILTLWFPCISVPCVPPVPARTRYHMIGTTYVGVVRSTRVGAHRESDHAPLGFGSRRDHLRDVLAAPLRCVGSPSLRVRASSRGPRRDRRRQRAVEHVALHFLKSRFFPCTVLRPRAGRVNCHPVIHTRRLERRTERCAPRRATRPSPSVRRRPDGDARTKGRGERRRVRGGEPGDVSDAMFR